MVKNNKRHTLHIENKPNLKIYIHYLNGFFCPGLKQKTLMEYQCLLHKQSRISNNSGRASQFSYIDIIEINRGLYPSYLSFM